MNYDDVLDKDISIEEVNSAEFEFEGFLLVKVNNHFEIQFEDNEGFKSIIVQLQDFDEKGIFKFTINSKEFTLTIEDFLNVEKFCKEHSL